MSQYLNKDKAKQILIEVPVKNSGTFLLQNISIIMQNMLLNNLFRDSTRGIIS